MGIKFGPPEYYKEKDHNDNDDRCLRETEEWKSQDYAELKAIVQDLKEKVDAMYHWYRYEYHP